MDFAKYLKFRDRDFTHYVTGYHAGRRFQYVTFSLTDAMETAEFLKREGYENVKTKTVDRYKEDQRAI
jgi:hypothetical protein